MGLYIVLLLTVGVTIYALVDCWNSTGDEVRGLPRPAWMLIAVLFPLVGSMSYLVFGRPRNEPAVSRPRVVAPDDDPDFLHQLDVQRRRAAAEERRRAQQAERRERKERERQDKLQRKERHSDTGTPNNTGGGASDGSADGGDHFGTPS